MASCASCGTTGVCGCEDSALTIPTGPMGLPGPQGNQGPQGLQGIQGIQGIAGTNAVVTAGKFLFTANPAGAGNILIQKLFLTSAGLFKNQYFVDANGVQTANSPAGNADFVWQVWKVSGVDLIDAELSGNVNGVTVLSNGDIQVSVTSAGSYQIMIIG